MYTKLHALRGVAACLVILFHSTFSIASKSQPIVSNFYLFVDLFFVISGFVMSHAYSEKISSGMRFGRYIGLRFARLYPLHAIMLVVWVVFVLCRQVLYDQGFGGTNQFDENNSRSLIANILLLHAMGVTDSLSWNQPSWSISAEFYTYIVFFLTTRFLDRSRSPVLPLLVTVTFYGYLFCVKRVGSLDLTYDYGFIRCLPAFYLGVFLYRVRDAIGRQLVAWRMHCAEIVVVTLTLLCLSLARESRVALMAAPVCFGGMLAVFSCSQDGWIGRALRQRWMESLGEWSYSIYMTHKIILVCAANVVEFVLHIDPRQPFGLLSPLINVALVAIVIAVSRFTYAHIERKGKAVVVALLDRRLPSTA